MNFQPPDPPEYGHCLNCKTSIHQDEVRGDRCIECETEAMTNKPMLSVEQELLERIAKPLKVLADKPFRTKAILELRALLDKEVDGDSHAPKHQGEPVAWQRKSKMEDGKWFDLPSSEVTQAQRLGYEVRPVYAEQPAPASVVMPEPYGLAMFKMLSGFDSVTPEQFNLVWTACRKEVARLNGVKP